MRDERRLKPISSDGAALPPSQRSTSLPIAPAFTGTPMFAKRQRNVRAALERIIERAGEVDVTASAVVAAVQAYSKINAAGQWIDRTEQVSLNDLFDRMSTEELEEYAQRGTLPKWFEAAAQTATGADSQV